MTLRKINATASTNDSLKTLLKQEDVPDGFVLLTEKQTAGRGQMGTVWQSQEGKSLTFSVFKQPVDLKVSHHFYVSKVVSLSVLETLNAFNGKELKIKWPNDILSDSRKICGILIENILTQQSLKSCIIGIGININETSFDNLPQATSLKLQTGKDADRQEILFRFLENLNQKWAWLDHKYFSLIDKNYHDALYRLNLVSTFEDKNHFRFNGIVRGVSVAGKLQLETEHRGIAEYDLKEINFL